MVKASISHFQINKAIVKLANVYIAPRALVQELYSLVLNITKYNNQNEYIVDEDDELWI